MRGLVLVGPTPPPSGGVASHLDDLAAAARAEGVAVRRIDTGGDRARVAARVAAGGAAAWARGDLVHLHTNGHNVGSWRLIDLVATVAGARERLVLTVHSGLAPGFIAGARARCRRAIARYGQVVCVSDAVADALAAAGVDRARLVVAPAFSSLRLPLPFAPAGLAAIRRRHPTLVAAMVSPGAEYGADLLVEAFARLAAARPEAGLVVCGPGGRDLSLARRVAEAGLAGRAYLFGDLGRAESLGVLAAADLFVRPTRADGDSVSVREALALGRRVVASDASLRPSPVTLFPAGDAAALADAMARALDAAPPAPVAFDGVGPVLAAYRAAGLALAASAAGPSSVTAAPPPASPPPARSVMRAA